MDKHRAILYMSEDEVLSIPKSALPLAVLSADSNALFSLGIRWRRNSTWNHFMWMHRPGYFASQGFTYSEVPVTKFIGVGKRLKFWHNPSWNLQERQALLNCIDVWLKKPAFTTRYDWIAIVGQALGVAWIQNPLTRICSEYGTLLRESEVDPRYDLKTPAPDEVDAWFNCHSEYEVFGRYAGE